MKKLLLTLIILAISVLSNVYSQCPTFSISSSTSSFTLWCVPANTLSLNAVNTSTLSSINYTWTNPSLISTVGSSYTLSAPGTYTVKASSATSTCVITQTLAISQNTVLPSVCYITPTSGTLTCASYVNTFTAICTATIGSVQIQWFDSFGGVLGGLSNSPYPFSINYPGPYIAVFTNISNGCMVSQTITVYSNTIQPTVNITGATTLCLGSGNNLTASGASNYTWSTGATASVIAISPSVTTTYTVKGVNAVSGCSNTATFTQSVSSCIGINEKESVSMSLSLYPQPAKDIVNISLINYPEKNINVAIIDLTGKTIERKDLMLENGKAQLQLNSLSEGIYFVRIRNSLNQIAVKKMVVTR